MHLHKNTKITFNTLIYAFRYFFDSTFLNVKPELNEYIPIYSIVNSLCELTTVTKVRILVNGSQDVMFRDVVSLNAAFERNEEYSGEPQ